MSSDLPLPLSHSVYYYFVTKVSLFPISCLVSAFLMILQFLHIFWSYVIIQMIFSVILCGEVRKVFVSFVPPLLMREHEVQGDSYLPAGKQERNGTALQTAQELLKAYVGSCKDALCHEDQSRSSLLACSCVLVTWEPSTDLSPHCLIASQYVVLENWNLLVCPKWSKEGATR